MEKLEIEDTSKQLVEQLLDELIGLEMEVKEAGECELYLERLKVLKLYSEKRLLHQDRILGLFRGIINNNALFLTNVNFFNEVLDHAIPLVLLCDDMSENNVHRILVEECKRFVWYLSSFKLTEFVALARTAESAGKLMGALLRKDIERGERTPAETFISELGSLLLFEPATSDTCTNGTHLLCPTVVPLYGTLAVQCQDEALTELCMNVLITQFEKGAYGSRTCLFFDQFNLLASSTSISCFNKSLDIYTRIYLDYEKDEFLAGEISKGLLGLIAKCSLEHQKLEVIVISLLKVFVDKGISILGESTKEPPKVLEFLLAPISLVFEHLQEIKRIPHEAVIGIFQEFWFVLVYFGYQPKLRWSDGWKNHVFIVALCTPVLIKMHPNGEMRQISKTLLAKNVNPQLKAHLISLMPNCAKLAKSLSMGQCLWLLSFYQSESFKFSIGQFDGLPRYLRSKAIQHLGLYPYVGDISITIVLQWIHQNAERRSDHLLQLALLMMENLGNRLECVHHTALTILKYILEHHPVVLRHNSFWSKLVGNILRRIFENTFADLNTQCEHSDWIHNQAQCERSFTEVKEFISAASLKAYTKFPVDMHVFGETFFAKERDIYFRNFVISLLSNRPPSLILKALGGRSY